MNPEELGCMLSAPRVTELAIVTSSENRKTRPPRIIAAATWRIYG
jgi:hypothetical protein